MLAASPAENISSGMIDTCDDMAFNCDWCGPPLLSVHCRPVNCQAIYIISSHKQICSFYWQLTVPTESYAALINGWICGIISCGRKPTDLHLSFVLQCQLLHTNSPQLTDSLGSEWSQWQRAVNLAVRVLSGRAVYSQILWSCSCLCFFWICAEEVLLTACQMQWAAAVIMCTIQPDSCKRVQRALGTSSVCSDSTHLFFSLNISCSDIVSLYRYFIHWITDCFSMQFTACKYVLDSY